jgi:signal transduction histidine kinase
MSRMLREAVAQTRALARGLVPVGGGPDALLIGLAEFVERINTLGQVRCRLDAPETFALKDVTVASHLYRIAQEAVNNAVKHAHGAAIALTLAQSAREIVLEIRDQGPGLPKGARERGGLGLRVMQHRANVIGAELTIASKRGEGVTIRCVLPTKTS